MKSIWSLSGLHWARWIALWTCFLLVVVNLADASAGAQDEASLPATEPAGQAASASRSSTVTAAPVVVTTRALDMATLTVVDFGDRE